MKSVLPSVVLLCGVLFLSASCSGQDVAPRTLHLGSAPFKTEIVNTPEGREHGLMGRTDLTDETAMLFVFPDEGNRVFWMKDTPTPLSIAYISKQGVVKEILDMEAFSLAPIPSKYSVPYALEVKLGAFARRGVKVGDTIPAADLTGLSASR
jgi:hypothetical protein